MAIRRFIGFFLMLALWGSGFGPALVVSAQIGPALAQVATNATAQASALRLTFSTFQGGRGDETLVAVAACGDLVAYGGFTNSTGMSTVNPRQAAYGGGPLDGYLAILEGVQSTQGISYTYKTRTYQGGTGTDRVTAVGFNPSCTRLAVAIVTDSSVWVDQPSGRGTEGLIRIFDLTGVPVRDKVLGGASDEEINALQLVNADYVCMTGSSASDGQPTTIGAAQALRAGGKDVIVGCMDFGASPAAWDYLSYYGGPTDDIATSLATYGPMMYMCGVTNGEFPESPGPDLHGGGGQDAFALSIQRPDFRGLGGNSYARIFGGEGSEGCTRLINSGQEVTFIGYTDSPGFLEDRLHESGGGYDAFAIELSSAGNMTMGWRWGNESDDIPVGVVHGRQPGSFQVAVNTCHVLQEVQQTAPCPAGQSDVYMWKIDDFSTGNYLNLPGDQFVYGMVESGNSLLIVGKSSPELPLLNYLELYQGGTVDGMILRYELEPASFHSLYLPAVLKP